METARVLVALVAIITAVGGLLADYFIPSSGRQHIKNPNWPPHAKFHNGQTILMGLALGVIALVVLYWQPVLDGESVLSAAVLASLYWVCLLAAPIFPGTAWTDPEFETVTPKPLGFHGQQLLAFVLLAILAVAILLSRS